MVLAVGVEPTRCYPHAAEACASAIFRHASMVQSAGVEPTASRLSTWCVCHFATTAGHRCRDSNPNERFWRPPGYPLPHTYVSSYFRHASQRSRQESNLHPAVSKTAPLSN